LEINGNIALPNSTGLKSIYTWNGGDNNWRIGMNENPGFTRGLSTAHVQYLTYGNGATQGFAVGVNGGNSSFEVRGSDHQAYFRGNVGIGTTATDKGALQVKGSVHVENSSGNQVFHISAGKQLVFVGDSAWIQYQKSATLPNSPIQQNNFSMWVSKGLVTQDLAIVKPKYWADHVFEDSYHLAPLSEVESYIQTNGHLPNIPSTQEVTENGYTVQIINARFLEKIEELTLYSIEQDKKLRTQEQELDQLKARLAALEALVEKTVK
jgi:hypothetical protein